MDHVTILVPVHNEADSLSALRQEIGRVRKELACPAQLIFVDDGSTDGTWDFLAAWAQDDAELTALRLRGNRGKSIALQAGIEANRSEFLVTMDGDLQDDPAEIPRLLAKLDEGFDVVSGWKQRRQDSWSKKLASRLFNWTISRLTHVALHDHNCGLKAYRSRVFDRICLRDGLHRYIPVLAARQGFRVTEIPVHHRPRRHGRSHYGWGRMLEAVSDLFGIFLFSKGQCPEPRPVTQEVVAEILRADFNG